MNRRNINLKMLKNCKSFFIFMIKYIFIIIINSKNDKNDKISTLINKSKHLINNSDTSIFLCNPFPTIQLTQFIDHFL